MNTILYPHNLGTKNKGWERVWVEDEESEDPNLWNKFVIDQGCKGSLVFGENSRHFTLFFAQLDIYDLGLRKLC